MALASPASRVAAIRAERPAAPRIRRDSMCRALRDAVIKLDPRRQIRNPAMFVVEFGALITTVAGLVQAFGGAGHRELDPAWYTLTVSLWLWLTVGFANLAQAVAEEDGRMQAESLRATRRRTPAWSLDGQVKAATELIRGDIVSVAAGELVPGDGTVLRGIAVVDESAITGESAPVIRESGRERNAVIGGTRVLSDQIVVEITQEPGQSYLDRMISLVQEGVLRRTPAQIALGLPLAGLTLIIVVAVALRPFGLFAGTAISDTMLIALVPVLLAATLGALFAASRTPGAARLACGTALAFRPMPGVAEAELAEVAQLASLADETPEGRSIVVLAKQYGLREHELRDAPVEFVPFSAATRMSGVDLDGRRLRKGAADAVLAFVTTQGGRAPAELPGALERISREGARPLVVAKDARIMGVISLQATVTPGLRGRAEQLRMMARAPVTREGLESDGRGMR